MWRRVFLLFFVLFLVVGCGGCASSSSVFFDGPVKGELTVYYLSSQRLYRDGIQTFKDQYPEVAVNAISFDSASEMDTLVASELMSGQGPDVVLLDRSTTLDVEKSIESGLFLDMRNAGFLEDERLYASVLEACLTGEQQYIIPLSFTLPVLITSEEKLSERQMEVDVNTSLPDLLGMMKEELDTIDVTTDIGVNVSPRRMDFVYFMMQTAGILDLSDGRAQIHEEAFSELMALIKTIYDHSASRSTILRKYKNDFVGVATVTTFFLEDYPPLYNARYYHTYYEKGLEEDMRMIALPLYDQPGCYNADIMQYAVVSKETGNPSACAALLRSLMDGGEPDMTYSKYYETDKMLDLSVNREYNEAMWEALENSGGGNAKINGEQVPIVPLPESYRQALLPILDHIATASLRNESVSQIVTNCMQPYLDGTNTYEVCYDDMMNRLNLYLGE